MSEVVHNLPPENGADKDPAKWENSYDKDPRGIDKVWKSGDRVEQKEITEAENISSADLAKVAKKFKTRLKDREVTPADESDTRNFEYYQKKGK